MGCARPGIVGMVRAPTLSLLTAWSSECEANAVRAQSLIGPAKLLPNHSSSLSPVVRQRALTHPVAQHGQQHGTHDCDTIRIRGHRQSGERVRDSERGSGNPADPNARSCCACSRLSRRRRRRSRSSRSPVRPHARCPGPQFPGHISCCTEPARSVVRKCATCCRAHHLLAAPTTRSSAARAAASPLPGDSVPCHHRSD